MGFFEVVRNTRSCLGKKPKKQKQSYCFEKGARGTRPHELKIRCFGRFLNITFRLTQREERGEKRGKEREDTVTVTVTRCY